MCTELMHFLTCHFNTKKFVPYQCICIGILKYLAFAILSQCRRAHCRFESFSVSNLPNYCFEKQPWLATVLPSELGMSHLTLNFESIILMLFGCLIHPQTQLQQTSLMAMSFAPLISRNFYTAEIKTPLFCAH